MADSYPLDSFYIHGNVAAVQTAGSQSDDSVCPLDGVLLGAWITFDTIIGTTASEDLTFDVFKNDADAGFDLSVPDTSAAKTGLWLPAPQLEEFAQGDSISVHTNGEQVAATIANIVFVFRRTQN